MIDFGDVFDSTSDPKSGKFHQKEKRVILKSKKNVNDTLFDGTVFASMGKNFIVCPDNETANFIDCIYGATIQTSHSDTSILSVGDYVRFTLKKGKEKLGRIVSVGERFSKLSRKSIGYEQEQVIASNMDYLIITVSADEPPYNKRLIDRMLIAAEQGNMTPVICVNKCDLFSPSEILEDLSIYQDLGIELFIISTKTGQNFSSFASFLSGKNSVMSGPSGVGKSSIINTIFGEEQQIINIISQRTNKGQHTTSYSKMFTLPEGGYLVDTPGIREFYPWGIGKEELPFFFHDFDNYFRDCKYLPCSHTHEPDCRIIEAVDAGDIAVERYQSYLNIYDSL